MKLAWDTQVKLETLAGKYQRDRSAKPYHTNRWTRLSRAFRAEHPLCAECQKQGIMKAAEVVDHIVPWPVCQDFFDRKNLQSLCEDCNRAKGNRDKKLIAQWRNNNKSDEKTETTFRLRRR